MSRLSRVDLIDQERARVVERVRQLLGADQEVRKGGARVMRMGKRKNKLTAFVWVCVDVDRMIRRPNKDGE